MNIFSHSSRIQLSSSSEKQKGVPYYYIGIVSGQQNLGLSILAPLYIQYNIYTISPNQK